MQNHSEFHKRVTLAGSLIAVGIVFGDIGTSPLYTLNAVQSTTWYSLVVLYRLQMSLDYLPV